MSTTTPQSSAPNARPAPAADHATRKGKAKKSTDPAHTSKQIEDTIAQLEKSRAGDKEQEMEIEREVKKANRDLSNLLSTMEAPMSRLEIVQRKYTELLADMKRTEREHVKSKKRADQLQKEKDTARSELTKMTSQKDRLEKLCREMQKDNKKLKDEHRALSENETKLREELHKRLEGLAFDVKDLIDHNENPESTPANIESDELFRHKFKSFIDQYELREIQFSSLMRNKELELQYQVARSEQTRKAQEEEQRKTRQLTTQVATFSQTEAELRSQLNIYVEKFKQVEDTLNNSNELFTTFRKEMEEMSKTKKKLEKDNSALTRNKELTSANVFQMAEERQTHLKELELLRKKNENLEKLCRGMQAQGRGGAVMQQAQQQARLAHQQQAARNAQQPLQREGPSTQLHNGQAMAHSAGSDLVDDLDEEGTESDYEYDDELDESEGIEYEDDGEEEAHARAVLQHSAGTNPGMGMSGKLPEGQRALPTYGPSPPPPALPPDFKARPVSTQRLGDTAGDSRRGAGILEGGKQVAVNGTGH
ncbi:MAG: hypothetical protein Q9159_004548 [Coniocarpon cinnabarinum]